MQSEHVETVPVSLVNKVHLNMIVNKTFRVQHTFFAMIYIQHEPRNLIPYLSISQTCHHQSYRQSFLPVIINLIQRKSGWQLISGIGELLVNQLLVLFDLFLIWCLLSKCEWWPVPDFCLRWLTYSWRVGSSLSYFTFDSRGSLSVY